MSTLSTLPTYNIYAESQDSRTNSILVGEFDFNLEFLQKYFPCVVADTSVPVVGLSSDLDTVNEGENLALNFNLDRAVSAGGLTVELDLIEGSDSFAKGFEFLPDASSNITNLEFITQGAEVTGAEVTIAEGVTDASIVSEIVADGVTEGDESVSLGLVDGDAYDVTGDNVNFTIIDTSTDLGDASIEVEDVSIPFLGDVDFAVNIDYIDLLDESQFVSKTEIADSIDRFLVAELNDSNISELQVEELTEFIISDSNLGISSLSDSVTVELSIEPNSLIPNPIEVSSTILVSDVG